MYQIKVVKNARVIYRYRLEFFFIISYNLQCSLFGFFCMAVNQGPKSRFFHLTQFKAVCLTQSFGSLLNLELICRA